jgi:hypothetical protein
MRRLEAGYQLIELLIALAISGTVLVAGIPPLMRLTAKLRVELAAAEVASTLRVARAFAIRHSANVGLKFRVRPDGSVVWALYRDADDDGVRTDDIDAGVDPEVLPEQRLAHFGRSVRFGFPPGRAPRDPSNPRRRLDRLDDPIRFNLSDIASFSHLGTSTPGSVYITDGQSYLSAARVFGITGKVTVLSYDVRTERWR